MINFLIGNQTQNVQQEIINKLVNDYTDNPTKNYFLIVPNHIKFDSEVQVLRTLAAKKQLNQDVDDLANTSVSVKNIQILSFSRLAWFFLKDSKEKIPSELSDAAASMILQRIVKEVQPELQIYQHTKINPGMIEQIYQSIIQLQIGNVSPDDLAEYDLTNASMETRAKIHDLRLIYPKFLQTIGNTFITKQETLQILNEYLAGDECDLSAFNFYVSDFSQFSAQEQLMLKVLIQKSNNVLLGFKTGTGDYNPTASINDYDGNIQLLIKQLYNFALNKQKQVSFLSTELESTNPTIQEFIKYWSDNTSSISANISDSNNQENIIQSTKEKYSKVLQLTKADTRYAEAYFVAQTIYREVALNNARYRDFIVLAPSLNDYETHLGPIFNQLNIPYFNDLQKEMKYHPVVIMLESLAELLTQPLKTEAIIKLLKTNLISVDSFDTAQNQTLRDQLENFVLKYGINYKRWNQDFKDFIDPEVLNDATSAVFIKNIEQLNLFKDDIVNKVTKFLKKFNQKQETNQALQYFIDFLKDLKIPEQLEAWRDEANDKGDLQLAQQPEEVWQTLNQLLDDYRLINQDNFVAQEFFDTILAGFAKATFSQIPSTLDAVTISELGMVQSNHYQQSFIIGATMGDLPQNSSTPKFLNSENINDLADQFTESSFIEDQVKTNVQMQNFQFGQALSLAAKRIYLSYPIINNDNSQLNPSLYYTKILNNFELTEYCQFDLPDLTGSNIGSYLSTPISSAGYLSYLVNNPETDAQAKTLSQRLLKLAEEVSPRTINSFIEAQKYNNTPKDLSPQQANELFNQNLSASISKLESYYRNPFEFFLKYGLRLRKRDLNEFDAMQTGNYFHEIFDEFVKNVVNQAIKLDTLTPPELTSLLAKIEQHVQSLPKYQHYLQDDLNAYLASRLNKTANSITQTWINRLDNTPMRPVKSEFIFGQGEFPGLNYEVGGHKIKLRGKIDRIDLAQTENGTLAQVIDYKSSDQDFDINKFYNGLSLQMVSYLKVLQEHSSQLVPNDNLLLAGAFYQIISNRPISVNKDGFAKRNFEPVDLTSKFKAQQRLQGLMISDENVLSEIETNLTGQSEIYKSLSFVKKDNSLKIRKNGFTPTEMKILMQFDEYLIKQAAQKIYAGEFPLQPFKDGQANAITNSEFKEIMLFDAMLPENNYQRIRRIEPNELLDKMKEELEND